MVGIFGPQKIGPVLPSTSTIRDAMDEWMPSLDLAHSKGQTTVLHNVLIVDLTYSVGSQIPMAGILDFEKVGTPFFYGSIIKCLMNKQR